MRVPGKFIINSQGISWYSGSSTKESREIETACERLSLLGLKLWRCSDLKSSFGWDSTGKS